MPVINEIRVTVFHVPSQMESNQISSPMDRYERFRMRRQDWYGSMESVLLEIFAGGQVGRSVTQGGMSVATLLEGFYSKLLLGAVATDIAELWNICFDASFIFGTDGLSSMARSAIDNALWDLNGQMSQKPVYELLGSSEASALPVYASGNDVQHHKDLGITASKIGVQAGPYADNHIERLQQFLVDTRREAGEAHGLMFDAWMGWDFATAAAMIGPLEDISACWIEEPLLPHDFDGYQELAKMCNTLQISAGEHLYNARKLEQLLRTGVTIVQPDLAWCGGITAGQEMAQLTARFSNATFAPHIGGSHPWAAHLLAHVAKSQSIATEWFIESTRSNLNGPAVNVMQKSIAPVDGVIHIDDSPGFGVEYCLETVMKYAMYTVTISI